MFSKIVGILNLTPDSFSDGGLYLNPQQALIQALRMQEEGADVLDIGAESTRPGATELSVQEELDRLLPVLELLKDKVKIPLSLDTRKVKVLEAALSYGISYINDVSGFEFDKDMLDFAASQSLQIILMHSRGTPQNMSQQNNYQNLMTEIMAFFDSKLEVFDKKSIERNRVILDPGIGFAKVGHQNIEVLSQLQSLKKWDLPLLIGLSRKSFLSSYLPASHVPAERNVLTEVAHAWCLLNLKDHPLYLRVHDVAAVKRSCALMMDFFCFSPS